MLSRVRGDWSVLTTSRKLTNQKRPPVIFKTGHWESEAAQHQSATKGPPTEAALLARCQEPLHTVCEGVVIIPLRECPSKTASVTSEAA